MLVLTVMAVTTCKAAQNCTRLPSLSQHPQGCWCFQSVHLPVHTVLPLLSACCLVPVPLFFTNKEPLTPTKHLPLPCSFAGVCSSIGCSFPSLGAFISQAELSYCSVHGLVCKCKACVCASCVTGTPVPKTKGVSPGALY